MCYNRLFLDIKIIKVFLYYMIIECVSIDIILRMGIRDLVYYWLLKEIVFDYFYWLGLKINNLLG